DAFEEVAKSLPYLLLVKHSPHILHLEAIILGQAGLLDKNFRDKYPLMLQKEYRFFAKKYGLQKIRLPMHFLRMRPPAFPTVRLAQLAMFLHKSRNLVNLFVHSPDIKCIRSELNVTANDYWHYHFNFDDDGSYFPKTVGAGMVNLILINGVIPFLYSY